MARAISLTQLLGQLAAQPVTAASQMLAVQLDIARLEMFGRYYQELDSRMVELRQVVDTGLARSRHGILDRVEELSAALHRDLIDMRQEQQRELEHLKRDVFSAVMSLSAVNDRISALETGMQQMATAARQSSFTVEPAVAQRWGTAAYAEQA
jgi:predicted  nucleic acid-binding Zn-ribbon protein